MSSNLPPGVTPGMIPGNRPEDEWWERFTEALDDLPSYLYDSDPVIAAHRVCAVLTSVSGFVHDGFVLGRQEGRIDAEEAAHDRMLEAEARLRESGLIEDREEG